MLILQINFTKINPVSVNITLYKGYPYCSRQMPMIRERYLRENIIKLEFGQQFSKQLGNDDFKHTLDLRIFVKKRN